MKKAFVLICSALLQSQPSSANQKYNESHYVP